jgi:cell division protease FtsH
MAENNFFDEFNSQDDKKKKNGNNKPKFTAIYYILAIVILLGIQVTFWMSSTTTEVPYSAFKQMLSEGKIESVQISQSRIYATLKSSYTIEEKNRQNNSFLRPKADVRRFYTVVTFRD